MFKEIKIQHGGQELAGHLSLQDSVRAWVIFAHGSGSSRKSPRNNWVAQRLNQAGFGTLLFDLLTEEEDAVYQNRFDIPLLGERLINATEWLMSSPYYRGGPVAYFGASTGAGAALVAAARAENKWPLLAVISRGGRPDLAGKENLIRVFTPTLLIVGGHDTEVIKLNEEAQNYLKNSRLVIVPGATHLFEEPGAMDEVVELAQNWLLTHLDSFQTSEAHL